MNHEQIWNSEATITDLLGDDVPAWIEQDMTANTVIAIWQGGCSSGAYMPAVIYHAARDMMNDHGDDVLQYIEDNLGELPKPANDESWSGMAVFFLSCAIELWASGILSELEALETSAD